MIKELLKQAVKYLSCFDLSKADEISKLIMDINAELEKPDPDLVAWIDKAKKLAGEYAHCYAFVGDDTMPIKHKQLMDHLDSIGKNMVS